jgi:ABC-2 type transport system ATP-binding protein/lipopolysaccharide transport system ATP-binding protein
MTAIELKNVSKKYRRHSDRRLATTLRSYLGYDLWRRRNNNHDMIWALRDLNLKVEEGTTLGVIGRNGSGKSSLIKLISRILKPDMGTVSVHGKVAALIELGAGFHPELTGRENVIINGIILGLSRREIKDKFSEIVDFAEMRAYIDEPIRTYSNGMYMRLGFAVAVHVNPEILLIDEVLAVGDLQFVQKCMDRMNQFKKEGKTIILVSHDLMTVKNWCDKAMWLDEGRVKMEGDPKDVVQAYAKEKL